MTRSRYWDGSLKWIELSYIIRFESGSPDAERRFSTLPQREVAKPIEHQLTGMPQLVDIPAPAMTTTFLADAMVSAMSLKAGVSVGEISSIGIFKES